MKLFQNKDKIINIFVLAPPAAGKTHFLTGLYLKGLEMSKGPTNPSTYVLQLVNELHGTNYWLMETERIEDYQFTYDMGKKRVILKSINYPNCLLRYISPHICNISNTNNITSDDDMLDLMTKRSMSIAQNIVNADKLIFIIDGGRYPNFENMGIIDYLKIVGKLYDHRRLGKGKCYIVVTKCDRFTDEFKNYEDYESFREFIKNKFCSDVGMRLLASISDATFHPVFYHTHLKDNRNMPNRDENGNFCTYGFDKIIDQLIT